ncbi:DUF7577 domain-containing protein [Halopiger xanaduensis]
MARRQSQSRRRVTCRVCGTENDGFYTYCRNCLGTLPANRV